MPPPPEDLSADLRKTAHDLNNLVAVLMGYADALSRSLEAADPRRKHLDPLLEALSRSEGTVRRLSVLLQGGRLEDILPARRPAEEKVLAGKETVLLVDDEEALRGVTGRFLGMNGYKVLEAGGAEEALEAFDVSQGAVDVLVTDLMMAGLGGAELARRLRARKPALKVLFLSGNGTDEVRRRAGEGGAEGFMTKPFRPKDLLALLRDVLDADPRSAAG